MDRFRVPKLLVSTAALTKALAGDDGTCPPTLRVLTESLDRPGFALRPLQVRCSRVTTVGGVRARDTLVERGLGFGLGFGMRVRLG